MNTKLGGLFWPKIDMWEKHFIPYIYKEIYLEGIYIDILRDRKDMVILDIGANIGCTVQYFRDYAKKVYAIEPSTEHFDALSKNREYNEWDNVEIFNLAMSGKDGEEYLSLNEANHTMHSLMPREGDSNAARAGWTSGERVKTQTFATFMKENNIDHIDFVKLDCEGVEDDILRHESFKEIAPKIKSMLIEMHHPNFPDLVKYMQELGYSAKRYPSSAVIVLFTR
jgi:FkbM family methyltransferase